MGDRPIYAKDFNVVACGKIIASSKRRIRWHFGWADPDALAAGKTGEACRGEEHDVTMIWSVDSRKLLMINDGREVYYSEQQAPRVNVLWKTPGSRGLRVAANATARGAGRGHGSSHSSSS